MDLKKIAQIVLEVMLSIIALAIAWVLLKSGYNLLTNVNVDWIAIGKVSSGIAALAGGVFLTVSGLRLIHKTLKKIYQRSETTK